MRVLDRAKNRCRKAPPQEATAGSSNADRCHRRPNRPNGQQDPRHGEANEYVFDIGLRKDLFVQSATLLEPVPVRRPLSELPNHRIETQWPYVSAGRELRVS